MREYGKDTSNTDTYLFWSRKEIIAPGPYIYVLHFYSSSYKLDENQPKQGRRKFQTNNMLYIILADVQELTMSK